MDRTTQIRVRDARDRLIDLLGLGKTFPLRDLPVRSEHPKVPFGKQTKIFIDYSQPRVNYQLKDHREGQDIVPADGSKRVMEGTGGTIFLISDRIEERRTFDILATTKIEKTEEGIEESQEPREAYLYEDAIVRVGLDETLDAWIELPPLNPNEVPANAWITDYGEKVTVKMDRSQEGVKYTLIDGAGQPLSEPPVPGLGDKQISLEWETVQEDTDIQIRAEKDFGGGDPESVDLKKVLPLKVRANPAVPISADVSIIEFGQEAIVKLKDTQASVRYQLYSCGIRDSEFIFPELPGELHEPPDDVIEVMVEEANHRVIVRRPKRYTPCQDIEGFEPLGKLTKSNAGDFALPVPELTRDSLILVQAGKEHVNGPADSGGAVIPSFVQLDQALMVLVRPDPDQDLVLRVWFEDAKPTGVMEVDNGQSGVIYEFENDSGTKLWSAYFHQKDGDKASLNKGIDQLRVGVDFVVARDPDPADTGAYDPTTTLPPPPRFDTEPLPPLRVGDKLNVLARKAQTRVPVRLSGIAEIARVPEVHAEPEQVRAGGEAKIRVSSSSREEKYRLTLNGNAVWEDQGNGEPLDINTGPIPADAKFELIVSRPGEPETLQVDRVVPITLTVTND